MGISQSLKIENLYQVMSTFKLKINVNLPQLFVLLFLRLKMAYLSDLVGGWKAHFRLLQRQANFHPEIRIASLPNQTPHKLKG